MRSVLFAVSLAVGACACTGSPKSSRPPDDPVALQPKEDVPVVPAESARSPARNALAPPCSPVPSDPTVASVPLPGDRTLHIVGKPVRDVESDDTHAIIAARLLLSRGACLLSQAPIGELSRAADDEMREELGEVRPIGGHQENRFAVEYGRVGEHEVLLVFVPLEVQWGLREYHVAPFTMVNDQLVAGDRVQSGRDAMGGEVYYGQAKVDGGDLLILRHGVRGMLPPIRLRVAGDGVIRRTASPP